MNKQYISSTYPSSCEADTLALAAKLAAAIQPGVVIYLHGSLGAGKTTFVRGYLRSLGYDGKVKSPTYTLVEPYELDGFTLNHFDLYRVDQAEELNHMGIDEYFAKDTVCLVEWPEKGAPILPEADVTCYIEKVDDPNCRQIRFVAHSKSGEEIVARL